MKQLLLAISMLVSVTCFAKIPTPQKDTYVNDFAKVLKPSQISALNAKIHRIERLSGVQFAVVLIDKLPAEYDIEEYTLLLARKWHVGKNKNGLVYVAAIGQRKQRLEVARKLTDKLTDSKCAEVLGVIKPYFREQDYNGGIDAMVNKLTDELVPAQPVAQQAAPVRHVQAKKEKGGFGDTLAGVLAAGIMLAIPALIIWLIVRAVRGNSSRRAYQQQMMYGQQPMGFNNGYGGGGYGGGPVINNYNGGGGYGSSGIGSGVGGFIAGAATGYAARTIQDHFSDHHEHDQHSDYTAGNPSADDEDSYDTSINDSDTDSSNWGDWGSSGDSSDSSSSDSDSSSSNSGFDGDSGATSDW